MTGSKRKKRYKKQSRAVILGILLVAGLLCGALILKTRNLRVKDDGYAKKEQELTEQIEDAKKESESLEEEEIYIKTKKYIEEIAKTKLGLVNPGETVLKPSGEDD